MFHTIQQHARNSVEKKRNTPNANLHRAYQADEMCKTDIYPVLKLVFGDILSVVMSVYFQMSTGTSVL